MKTYVPAPIGDWGMVFEGRLDEHGRPFMHCLAFGGRRPLRATQPSVYQIAAQRLNTP